MNKVVKSLVLSDLFIMSGFGLAQPVFAVFIIDDIPGATFVSVGIAAAIALFTKAIFQLLVAKWNDEERGNCHELYALVAGSFIVSFVPLGYAVTHTIWQLYLTQFFYGLGQAMAYPSWRVLFSRYADGVSAGFEWGMYDTIISLGVAATAVLGSYLIELISFRWMFVVVAVLSLVGSTFLIYIFNTEFTCRVPWHKNK